MYDYIIGQVKRVSHEYIVLEQNQIGWCIYTPNPFAFQIVEANQQVYIHMHVREDVQQLFGFKTIEQRELFRKLLQVSGIGPKGALAILASGNPSQVISAIESEDEAFLVKFPGVGKKTARQMILDLKGKLGSLMNDPNLVIPSKEDELPLFGVNPNQQHLEEAILALGALGYSDKELNKIKPQLEENDSLTTTESYMKQALQLLLTVK
ncbi:Holliday junction branch migration protein RuvA [Ureibacillus acetophenoni]|uniref:Holliday junction branch migration complex subunit RuvA n=1 Tax=Ureibacillus acetophenoni TaxID=614649 RepID=A0A285U3K4_9BACL|nr:Holliday junction branch migration protein RuvA [Ureibacillus acetophenoni]SOC36412.1 Holliday junction DNA helicase subunit RuvA [Ureibacillus acetophenoni]